MEPLDRESIPPRRPPRRAQTLPVRFVGLGRDESSVRERTDPKYRRQELREGGPTEPNLRRRQPRLVEEAEEDPPGPSLRRQGSSFREPIWLPESDGMPERRGGRDGPPKPRHGHRHGRRRERSGRERQYWGQSDDSTSHSEPNQTEDLPLGSNNEDESESYDSSDSQLSTVVVPNRFLRAKYDYEDDSEGSDINSDAYAFSLPRHEGSRDSTLVGSGSSVETEVSSESQVVVSGSRLGTTYHIYRSKYTGEGSIGGLQTAQLTTIHDPKKDRPRLFRWIHFEDPAMHFEEFQNGVTDIPGLTNTEKTGFTKLLRRAQKLYDKPLQTLKGTRVRSMEPSFLQETLPRGDGPKRKALRPGTIAWLCLPYFCLEEYSGILSASRSGAHPMRTLLQARLSLARKDRDLQQAVCSVAGTPEGFCFHIAQIWCVVLDDSLLVTCARRPISALQRDSVSVISVPMPEPSRGEPHRLLVSYGGSLLWSLHVDDCQTWFAFISNFWEFWPQRFRVTYKGKVLTAELWPQILTLSKQNIRLNFQLDTTNKTLTRGILHEPERPPILKDTSIDPSTNAQRNQTKDFRRSTDSKTSDSQAFTSIHDDTAAASSPPRANTGNGQAQGPSTSHETTMPPSAQPDSLLSNGFCVFTRLSAGKSTSGTTSFSINEEQMKEDLRFMDNFLSCKTSFSERIAYTKCPEVTFFVVYASLEEEGRAMAGSATKDQKEDERKRWIFERRVDMVNASKSIFQFFFPSTFEGPTVLKYWGAIHKLLMATSPDRPRDQSKRSKRGRKKEGDILPTERLLDVVDWLESVVLQIQPFRDLFSEAQLADQSNIDIPNELLKAWLHLIMAFVYCTRNSALWEDQMSKGASLIDEGMKKVVRGLTQKSLLEKSVLMPFEVASLVNFQLLQDVTGIHPDIREAYSEYLEGLEAKIEANPLDRAHQDKIALLKQEISVIRETLQKQAEVFTSILISNRSQSSRSRKEGDTRLRRYGEEDLYRPRSTYATAGSRFVAERASPYYTTRVEPRSYYLGRNTAYQTSSPIKGDPVIQSNDPPQHSQSQLSPIDPGGYRDLLVHDCIALIERRIRDFWEMNEKATDLEAWNIQKINSNRDRQESAIYIFTIVTVIFLPLSTVASILGMNTMDIRGMEKNQWVYWAIALPLMFAIAALCLIWTGELGNFWRGFANIWRRGSGRRGQGPVYIREASPYVEGHLPSPLIGQRRQYYERQALEHRPEIY